jgi:DNA polymerase-3 subunit alpha
MGFAGYFLIVADFIEYGKRNGVPVGPGRGSAAGSLCTFSLGITGVDPVEYDIIFERFLNPERVSMPDIDVDFCMRGRQKVIEYVKQKYDEEGDDGNRVAQIITFGKLQARAAIRDVGRVMGMPYGDVDRISKMVPEVLGISLADAIKQSPEMRACQEADSQVAKMLETALSLEGLTRHASTHAAGVVIGTKPLIEMVPLYRDPKTGDVVTQYDMRMVERCGLVKFDFLGLRTLTVIYDAQALIREDPDPNFDIENVVLNDPTTFDMLGKGDTAGVFQIESSGMTDLVVQLQPRTFKELIPIVALYRPGPLDAGMVDDYVQRKQGLKEVDYLLPEMEELTAETLGIIVYQDQVLQIANKVAGYSLGQADLLRRAMGKKKASEMAKQRQGFIDGSVANGIDEKKAGELFDLIEKFAGYGFAKSHSTAYSLIMYQTAYLKANYPAQYMAALMTSESGNHDKLSRYITDAREKGMEVLPPDISSSARDFRVVGGDIRFGFAGIKNLGEGAIESILQCREEGGPYTSFYDFTRRIDSKKVNKRGLEALVKSGAFDTTCQNRAAAWASIESALAAGASAQRDRELGQGSLFGDAEESVVSDPALPDVPEWSDQERLGYEKEILGFFVSGHPLEKYMALMRRFSQITSANTEGCDGREVRAAGVLQSMREIRTKRGSLMAFAELADLDGVIELVIFAEPYAMHRDLLKQAEARDSADPMPLVVSGEFETSDPPKILVREILALEKAEETLSTRLLLRVQISDLTKDRMEGLKRTLEMHKGDCEVQMHVLIPEESETRLSLVGSPNVRASEELIAVVDSLFGRPVAEYEV